MLVTGFKNTCIDEFLLHLLSSIPFGYNNNSRIFLACVSGLLLYYGTIGFDLIHFEIDSTSTHVFIYLGNWYLWR